jgi:O-antigen ligase
MKAKQSVANFLLLSSIPVSVLIINPNLNDTFNIPKYSALFLISILCLSIFPNLNYLINHIKLNFSLIFALLFILSMLVIATLTDHKFTAFVGRYGRNSGWLQYVSYFILMVTASIYFKTQLIKKLILIFTIMGAIISTYGYLQFFKIDFISYAHTGYPIITTFGNSNFTSSFIGIAIIGTFSLAADVKKLITKIFLAVLIVYELFLILLSKSTQGIFVSFVGVTIYIILKLYSKNLKFFLSGISLASFSFIFVILGFFKIGPLGAIVYQPSITYRGDYFRAAIDMLLSFPWTGVGIDRFGENYREFRDLDAAFRLGPSNTTNWAHNQFLQFFATGGIVLGATYILLILSILFIGIKNIRNLNDERREYAIAIFAMWVGYQSQTLVSIDQISITVVGWILGGIIISLKTEKVEEIRNPIKPKRLIRFDSRATFSLLLILFLLIKLIPIWQTDREIKVVASIPNINSETTTLVQNLSSNVINKAPNVVIYHLIAADKLATLGNYKLSENLLKNSTKIDPKSYQSYQYLARLHEVAGNFQKAIIIREKLQNMDRYDIENYSKLALNYSKLNKVFEFEDMLNSMKAVNIDSKYIKRIELDFNANKFMP